jgi:hypothetical protein
MFAARNIGFSVTNKKDMVLAGIRTKEVFFLVVQMTA